MFLISILLILISSYLILSVVFKNKKSAEFFCFLLIVFSQIIISFEILSLFKLISKNNFLICNICLFILSLILFLRNGSVIYIPNIKEEFKKIISALKQDKLLIFLSFCFIVFLLSVLIRALFFPVTFGDALVYYLTRCTAWIQNGCINHFITPDTRELIMPVNMEFLYTWVLLLRKEETGIAVFSYISFIAVIYLIYNFLKEIGFCVRKRLWSIFVFSSFVLISIQAYTPCSDMFIGSLILGSIYLFLISCKYNDKTALYFSALSYALAVGTKTTAIIAIPAVFILLFILGILYNKPNCKKLIFNFTVFFLINFFIFSSYNYILNFIQFSNPVSCSEQLLLNKFRGGIKGWLCNFTKYIFVIFDISGIKDITGYNEMITKFQDRVFTIFGETSKSYTSPYFGRYFGFNSDISILKSALGTMGLIALFPSVIMSFVNYFKHKKSKKAVVMVSLSLILLLNIIIFSGIMVYTSFNMRYLLTFVVISSPVLAYSYINIRFYKLVACWFMFVYLFLIAHKEPAAFLFSYAKYTLKNPPEVKKFIQLNGDEVSVYNYILNKNKRKIAVITSHINTPNYFVEKLRLNEFIIDKLLVENIEEYDLSKYDYIITNSYKVSSSNVLNYKSSISRCIYLDYERNVIYPKQNIKPATVECEIPFKYFLDNNFKIADDIKLSEYVILEKK